MARRLRGERGAIGVALAILMTGVLAAASLVVDGGRALAARRHAANVAEGAARAAVAAQLGRDIDLRVAATAARRHAAAAGIAARDVAVSVSAGEVHVVVTERRTAVFLALGGVEDLTMRGQGAAQTTYD
jgi:Flp pilus assembly protein TadG